MVYSKNKKKEPTKICQPSKETSSRKGSGLWLRYANKSKLAQNRKQDKCSVGNLKPLG